MPIFEVRVDDTIVAASGGDDIDILTFGILRAADARNAVVQLMGRRSPSMVHVQWLCLPLFAPHRVRVAFLEHGTQSRPVSTSELAKSADADSLQPEKEVLGGEMGARERPVGFLAMRLRDTAIVRARASASSNIQVTATWTKTTDVCKIEMGAIHIGANEQHEVWIEERIELGELCEIDICG